MALNPKLAVASRNLALDAGLDVLDGGGFFRVYDGTQPTDPDTALSGNTLLVECALTSDYAANASAGSKVVNAIAAATILAAGSASWCSFVKSNGTTRVRDGSVGTSGANLNLNSVALSAGAAFSVTGWTESMAA